MKPARIIVLVIALAAGGVAAMLASGNRTPPETPKGPEPPAPLATTDVLIAKSTLARGQVVAEGDVGWQIWPAASATSFIRKSDRPEAAKDFVGAIVRSPVSAGEPITDYKVVAANGRGFMATTLPKGRRAISVDIAPDTDAGGFILPNDHVDVVLTQRQSNNGTGTADFKTKTILTNMRVLAVDQTIGEKDGQQVIVGKTATIQADPQQAETLANARQLGNVSLALRSILDSQSTSQERRKHPNYVVVYRGKLREIYSCIGECVLGEAQMTDEVVSDDHEQDVSALNAGQ
jgi:pilus assembly protein CpaB